MAAKKASKVDVLWFKRTIEDKRKSQRQLAKFLKLDPSAVTLMLQGKRHIRVGEAVAIAEFLEKPLYEVLERAGIPASEVTPAAGGYVVITGWVDQEGIVHGTDFDGSGLAPAPANAADDLIALRYQTALTALDTVDGWLVYATLRGDIAPEAVGRLCVVQVAGEDVHRVGFVRRGYDRGQYMLLPLMGTEPQMVTLTSASPVLWLKP